MKLDAVQSAAQAKIEAEMQPVTSRLARLRAVLDAYEVTLRDDIERRVNNTILVALGQEAVPERDDFEQVRRALREALQEVNSALEPSSQDGAPEPEPAPAPTSVAPLSVPSEPSFAAMLAHGTGAPPQRPAQAPKKPPRKASPEDIENAKRLIAEVDGLRATYKAQHPVRLSPLLQAIAAETRIVLDHLPQDHFYIEKMNDIVQTVGRMRHDGGVKDFIKGLAYGSSAPWASIAAASRRKIEQFDRDAETPPTATRRAAPTPARKSPDPPPSSAHTWPELPFLRKLDKPIVLAGGMYIPEKVNSIYERFGLKVDWHAIDHDNPKAYGPLIGRIRGGKVGVILLVEGFMRHDVFKPIVDACSTCSVPMAYVDKAGVASIAAAFDELERKLATRKEGAA